MKVDYSRSYLAISFQLIYLGVIGNKKKVVIQKDLQVKQFVKITIAWSYIYFRYFLLLFVALQLTVLLCHQTQWHNLSTQKLSN